MNLEIPLLEVEQDGFKLPIKLTYNTSGILINNRNSWVGTNWNLDAGGVITRTINGDADEGKRGFFAKGGELNNPLWYTMTNIDQIFNKITKIISVEPDEFNFKAPGISGTFYIGNDQKAYVVGQPDVKVEMSIQGNLGLDVSWRTILITAPNGLKYLFFMKEKSTPVIDDSLTEKAPNIVSSWLLGSITFPGSGNSINFKYSNQLTDVTSYSREMYIYSKYEFGEGFWSDRGDCNEDIRGRQSVNIEHYYLDSIKGTNFNIIFTRSNKNASSTINWSQLEAITLFRKSDAKRLKDVKFEYNNKDAQSRFWLNSVHVSGQKKEDAIPPYYFVYYPYDGLSANYNIHFPTDHWGYLRGAGGATIPNVIRNESEFYYSIGRNTVPQDLIEGMLKQITYPTGGKIELIYESNDYSTYGETRNGVSVLMHKVKKMMNESAQLVASKKDFGGGLRIKELCYWNDNKRIATYKYKYITNYNTQNSYNDDKVIVSSGVLGNVPIYHYNLDLITPVNGTLMNSVCDATASQPFSEVSLTRGVVVGYSEVTEVVYDIGNRLNGYTKYKYSNFDTTPDIEPITLHTALSVSINARTSRSVDRGVLLSKEIYDKTFALKKKFNYYYSVEHPNNIRALQSTSLGQGPCSKIAGYAVAAYYVPLDTPDLIQETETTYDANGSSGLTKTTKYSYNDRKQTKEIKTLMNDGQTWHCKRFLYPNDFISDTIYTKMVNRNIIAPIVQQEEVTISPGNKVTNISKEKYNYCIINNRPAIDNYQSSKGTGALQTRIRYDNYDKKGNPLHITIDDKEEVIYLWGYNYQYIVAEIKNATMGQIKNIIGDIDEFEAADIPDASMFYQLRTQLKNALVRTFAFDLFVGKTSETDAKNVTTYFEYDQQNRLKYTRDYLGNIMEGYLYNYSNTNQ